MLKQTWVYRWRLVNLQTGTDFHLVVSSHQNPPFWSDTSSQLVLVLLKIKPLVRSGTTLHFFSEIACLVFCSIPTLAMMSCWDIPGFKGVSELCGTPCSLVKEVVFVLPISILVIISLVSRSSICPQHIDFSVLFFQTLNVIYLRVFLLRPISPISRHTRAELGSSTSSQRHSLSS